MNELFSIFTAPHMSFMRHAIAAGLLSSIAFGIVGTYVVVRRISYMAGAISHSVLGGIGMALYCQTIYNWRYCDPFLGALLAAIVAAVIIGAVNLSGTQREDSVIGAIWAIGMAAGIIFIAVTPGYTDAMSYLFGNILLLGKFDLWMIGILDVFVVVMVLMFYEKLLAICFDEEFARARGIHTGRYFLLLLLMTSLTVVLLIRVVGIVMVIALLTLPSAIAGMFSRRLISMMILSVFFCAIFTVLGLAVSYMLNLPSGPVIILAAGTFYILIVAANSLIRRTGG